MKIKSVNPLRILYILSASFVLGLLFNLVSPARIDFIKRQSDFVLLPDSTESVVNNTDTYKAEKSAASSNSIKIISNIQAFNSFSKKNALFIDARDQWEYSEGHIPGAINIAEYKFDGSDPVVLSLRKESPFILYCGGEDCDVSLRLAEKLRELGFENLFVFKDGWKGWIKNNYPVEKI